jgi:hypothetical protein
LQRFRCRTPLIFHHPVATRSVRVALRGNLLFAAGESAREARWAAKPPPNARNVKNSRRLLYHGIVKNSEVFVICRLLYHGIVWHKRWSLAETLLANKPHFPTQKRLNTSSMIFSLAVSPVSS